MLLGPGLNMKRSPLCGRNFEYFSEDPYLAGKLEGAYIRSLQKQGVAACVKHFAANNHETMRMNGSSNMDERTLHEIYLPAFEMAVKAVSYTHLDVYKRQLQGIIHDRDKGLILIDQAVRFSVLFQGFQEIFFWCQPFDSSTSAYLILL